MVSLVTPINQQSRNIDERYYIELVNIALDSSSSVANVYLMQVPNVRPELKSKPVSNRMAKLKKAGFIGCLNETGVTSSNYKEIIYGHVDTNC